MANTYPTPLAGWTCFHCGELFITEGKARLHFGERPDDGLACQIKAGCERGLLIELRKVITENYQLRLWRANRIAQDISGDIL